ncbi:hypothetical protein [Clostridium perfringens]|uniref:hypothetical protein n=1 Tax=Clostridium perfringens TaxID=1502 RepID=UPI0013737629|nr:hypothetical protein [Clostridium perfringens]ELC8345891.1 hypothetical protein [Clostridium perfringens]
MIRIKKYTNGIIFKIIPIELNIFSLNFNKAKRDINKPKISIKNIKNMLISYKPLK